MTPQNRSQSLWDASPDLPLADLLVVLLPRQRHRAVKIAVLAKMAGASKRDTEEALREIGASGKFPLCASTSAPYGVWLGSPDEVRQYVEELKGRLQNQRKRLAGLQTYLRNVPEPRLWDAAVEDAA